MENPTRSFASRIAPAITLMVMAPLFAEILPGATRFSAIFVFPIEMLVWGGGAVMIRELVRRNGLGAYNMAALALCLVIAEEWLIQQTSLAPLVIQLKGVEYARAGGVNYVYFLWAALYETIFVVFLPVMLVELLFPARCNDPWLSRAGWVVQGLLFAIGAFFAWFSWTQIARVKVFHLPPFTPPMAHVLIALAAIALLLFAAVGPWRRALADLARPIRPPAPPLLALGGAAWTILWFGMLLLAFGIKPDFPPAAAVAIGLGAAALLLVLMPGFALHPCRSDGHRAWLIAGTMLATMAIFFEAFVGAAPADYWFKLVTNAIAAGLFVALVMRVSRAGAATPLRS